MQPAVKPKQHRVRWRFLLIAILAIVVIPLVVLPLVVQPYLASIGVLFPGSTTSIGGPQPPPPTASQLAYGFVVDTVVPVVSALSGLVSIVRFGLDVGTAVRKRRAQPVAAGKTRAT
jgi:hypothetical protein